MAFDAFLKLDGINGESTDKNHLGWIEIDSFSWGVENSSSVGPSGGGAGKPSASDFNFLAPTSKASPKIMLACATGQHLSSAMLSCRKAGGPNQVEFLKITLTDCLISSYQTGGAGGGDETVPEDSTSIAFQKIDFLYTVAKTGEVVEAQFDFSQAVGS